MPSFYSAADQARRLALTPPEYHTGYPTLTAGDARLGGHPPYANHGHYLAYLEKDVPDYTDRFGRPPAYGPTATNTYHNQHQYQSQSQQPPLKATATASNASTAAHDAYYASRYGHRQRSYGPVAAPVLPSLRPNEPTAAAAAAAAAASRDHVRQSYPSLPEPTRTEPPKDDKPVGGVAAVLDYEMDQMAAFVAETAQRIVHSNALVSPAFRKFVSQVLSSTRLPRSTIMLALHYLFVRMRDMSSRELRQQQQHRDSSSLVYRMLTVALLLGSKFLDDNTFQNRSWSDVSGMRVGDLNALEREWLAATDWSLHVDPLADPAFAEISERWRQYTASVAVKQAASRLAPIDTAVASAYLHNNDGRHHHHHHQQYQQPQRYRHHPDASPVSCYALSAKGGSAVAATGSNSAHHAYLPPPTASYPQAWPYGRAQVEYSPPSAPETGPSTPDYGVDAGHWPYGAPAQYSLHPPVHAPPQQPPAYHQVPYSQQRVPSTIWGPHRAGCSCVYCVRPHDPHLMHSAYAPQIVA